MENLRTEQRRREGRLIDWLLDQPTSQLSFEALIAGLGERLVQEGCSVWRLSSNLQTYQPEVAVRNFSWIRDQGVEILDISHSRVDGPEYKASPIFASRQAGRPIRVRIEALETMPYPICEEMKTRGATDYFVNALPATSGTFVSYASNAKGGFSAEEIDLFAAIMPALVARLELYCSRWGLESLLNLYLGHNAAQRVIDGAFKLGGGEDIDAVVWMSDLRGFTAMTEASPVPEVLENLNEYFSCIVGPIQRHGGEVLKFIGDAVLGIFPIGDTDPSEVCSRSIAAARQSFAAIAEANQTRVENKQSRLEFGVALHLGKVAYGNIGTPRRLDFTVIGPTVNETARIESLCAKVQRPFLVSDAFRQHAKSITLESAGRHALKGVAEPQEIWTLLDLV